MLLEVVAFCEILIFQKNFSLKLELENDSFLINIVWNNHRFIYFSTEFYSIFINCYCEPSYSKNSLFLQLMYGHPLNAFPVFFVKGYLWLHFFLVVFEEGYRRGHVIYFWILRYWQAHIAVNTWSLALQWSILLIKVVASWWHI